MFKKVIKPETPTPEEEKQYNDYVSSAQFIASLPAGSVEIYNSNRANVLRQFDLLVQSAAQELAQRKQAALDKIQADRAKAVASDEQTERQKRFPAL